MMDQHDMDNLGDNDNDTLDELGLSTLDAAILPTQTH